LFPTVWMVAFMLLMVSQLLHRVEAPVTKTIVYHIFTVASLLLLSQLLVSIIVDLTKAAFKHDI